MQPHATFTLQLSMMYHGLTKLSDFLLFFTFGIGFVFGPYTLYQLCTPKFTNMLVYYVRCYTLTN